MARAVKVARRTGVAADKARAVAGTGRWNAEEEHVLALEELLIVILQFLAELLVELFLWCPWDFFIWWGERKSEPGRRPSGAGLLIAGFVLGSMMGGVSLLIQTATMLKHELARLLNLLITPAASGLAALGLARARLRRGRRTDPKAHFWFAIFFAAAFLLVRFTWAERPAIDPTIQPSAQRPRSHPGHES
jgi:hypothetical protein